MAYVIENEKGDSWFKMWTGIGPCFTLKREEAAEFQTRDEASDTSWRHAFAFTSYSVVESHHES